MGKEEKLVPSYIRTAPCSSFLNCLHTLCNMLSSVITEPSWRFIDHVNNCLQDIISLCQKDMDCKPPEQYRHAGYLKNRSRKAWAQLNILKLLKALLDLLESKADIEKLPENSDSLITLASSISTIVSAYKQNVDDDKLCEKIDGSFEAIFDKLRISSFCYMLLKIDSIYLGNFVRATYEVCSVCLEQNLTHRTDFIILSSCDHRFCVPCAQSWFKDK